MIRDGADEHGENGKRAQTKQPRIHLINRWSLHGQIMDLQAVNCGKGRNGADRLLMSFTEAKMSLVAFDAGTQSLVTESIHYYEHERLMQKSFDANQACMLRLDPECRCVAMRIYGDQVAILPLVALGESGDADGTRPYASSFVVDLQVEDVDVRNIRDFVFLGGYLEPTLAILHEQDPTWPGLLEFEHDTGSLTVVSLDLSNQSVSVLNSTSRLPSDSQILVPIPEPIGGVLVFATSSISHVVNGAVSCMCTLNKTAVHGIGVHMSGYIDSTSEHLELVLNPRASTCLLLNQNTLALWTQHGSVFMLQLVGDGRLVKQIRIRQIAGPDTTNGIRTPVADTWDEISLLPSCSTELRPVTNDESELSADVSLFFIGGKSGRSLLLGIERIEQKSNANDTQTGALFDGSSMDIDTELYGAPSSMRSSNRRHSSTVEDNGEYGASNQGPASEKWTDEYRILVHDELVGTGPIASMEIGHAIASLSAYPSEDDMELVTCAGNEWRGCLRVQQRHISPDVVASFDLPGPPVRKVWTVRCLKEYNIGGVMQAADSGSLADLNDAFMVLSRDNSTAVFAAGNKLSEMERSGFYTLGPTIEAGEVFGNTRVVQVYATGLRLVNSSARETQSIVLEGGLTIVSAEIQDPHVLLRTETGRFLLYEAKGDTGQLEAAIVPQPLRRGHVSCVSFFRDKHRVLISNKDWVERNRDILDEQAASKGDSAVADEDFDSLYADATVAKLRKRTHAHGAAKRRDKRRRGGDTFDELYEEEDEKNTEGQDDGRNHRRSLSKVDANGTDADSSERQNTRIDREEETAQEVRGEDPMYLLVLFTNGTLSIFRLPHFDLLWTTRKFDFLLETLSSDLFAMKMASQLSMAQANIDHIHGDDGSSSSSSSSSSNDGDSDEGDVNGEDMDTIESSAGGRRSGSNRLMGTRKKTTSESKNGSNERTAAGVHVHSKRIDQFQLVGMGGNSIMHLHLVVLTTAGEIAVYRAFEYCPSECITSLASRSNGNDSNDMNNIHPAVASENDLGLALRFTRMQHDVLAYEPDYERRVQEVQTKQKDAFAAWEMLSEAKLAQRVQAEARARESARTGKQHEDPTAVVDWDDDSDNEHQNNDDMRSSSDGDGSKISKSVMDVDKVANENKDRESNNDETQATESSLQLATSFTGQHVVDDLYADPGFGLTNVGNTNNTLDGDVGASVALEEKQSNVDKHGEQVDEAGINDNPNKDRRILAPLAWSRKLIALDNVGGYSAVFVSGLRPVLVIVGSKRYARVHPLRVPVKLPKTLMPENATKEFDAEAGGLLTRFRPVVGLARFHSSSCQRGFVALTQAGTLVVSMLPASIQAARGGIEYDAPWPVRCITVGTAHPGISTLGGVSFHPPSGSYAAIATTMQPFYIKEPDPEIAARHAREMEEERLVAAGKDPATAQSQLDAQQLIPEHSRNDLHTTSAPPLVPFFFMDLLSPVTWETVDSFPFDENEHVVDMRTLVLESSQAMSGSKPLICVATGFVLGEDVSSRGRIYIFDIVDVVPLPGRPQTNRRLKLLFKEEMRGTVNALGELRGNLVISVGSKIFVRSFSNGESLASIAFMDCQSWVKSLAGFKNYLLIGDLVNSIWFAGFQEDGPTKIQVLGRDFYNRLPVEYADMLVCGQQMQLMAADSHGILHFFLYAPRDVHSSSGLKLLRRGEYNLRSRITGVKRLVAPGRAGTGFGGSA
ncbi:mRNA cleavage and polyadenylation factor subunit, partial [Coemansia sp. RSA 1804]